MTVWDERDDEIVTLREENERLRKWFVKLVDFIRDDQCSPEDDCICCRTYLEVANDSASAGMPVRRVDDGEKR